VFQANKTPKLCSLLYPTHKASS